MIMTEPKDFALAALRGAKTGRVPVMAFLGGMWPITKSGYTLEALIGRPRETATVLARVNAALDADLITVGTGSTALLIAALGGKIKFRPRSAPEVVSLLPDTDEFLTQMNPGIILNDPGILWIRETARHLHGICGERRLLLVSGRAPFTLAAQMFGMERLFRALYRDVPRAHRMLALAAETALMYYGCILEGGHVHGALISDPSASGDVISRAHFEADALPGLKQTCQRVADYKGVSILHICGNISDRLALIPSTGADCLSLDSKVDIGTARQVLGPDYCLAGNVNPVECMEFGETEWVRRQARQCLQDGADTGPFVLMPGCDLGAGVPAANISALIASGHQWATDKEEYLNRR